MTIRSGRREGSEGRGERRVCISLSAVGFHCVSDSRSRMMAKREGAGGGQEEGERMRRESGVFLSLSLYQTLILVAENLSSSRVFHSLSTHFQLLILFARLLLLLLLLNPRTPLLSSALSSLHTSSPLFSSCARLPA